ncbi:MAG: hypothetical protein RR623_01380 [Bacilli bacterium]
MSDLRIIDAPEIPTEEITGSEKLPTGGNGNYSISLGSIANHTKKSLDLANKTDVQTSSNGVKAQLDQHKNDLNNPHQVTKGQIGLGNVNNTADADKPMSNAVQSAITTLANNKADKTSVYLKTETYNKSEIDSALSTKPNSTTVYTKTETDNLLNGKVTSVNGKTGTAITLNRSDLGISSDEVMQQWQKEAQYVIDGSGLSQQEWNNGVDSISDLLLINSPQDGNRVFVKSYHSGIGKGGDYFTYDSTLASTNNGVTIFNGWVRENKGYLLASDAGCREGSLFDNTDQLNNLMLIASEQNIGDCILDGVFEIGKLELGTTTTPFGNEPMWWLLKARSNITVKGRSWADGLFLKGGLVASNSSLANTKGYCVFGDYNQPNVENFTIENFTIDNNGQNNLLAPVNSFGSQSLCPNMWFQKGKNIRAENIHFFENPGHQTIVMDSGVTGFYAINNLFTDNGMGLVNNDEIIDHSTIYCRSTDFVVSGNNGIFTTLEPRISTFLEIHGVAGRVFSNHSKGYPFPLLRASYFGQNSDNVEMFSNTGSGVNVGCFYDGSDGSRLVAKFTNNNFTFRSKKPFDNHPQIAIGHVVGQFANITPSSTNEIILIAEDNRFIQPELSLDWSTFNLSDNGCFWGGKGTRTILKNNTFENFKSGYRINYSNPKATYSFENTRINCGNTADVFNSSLFTQNVSSDWASLQTKEITISDTLENCAYGSWSYFNESVTPFKVNILGLSTKWILPYNSASPDTSGYVRYEYTVEEIDPTKTLFSSGIKVLGKISYIDGSYFWKTLGNTNRWNFNRKLQATSAPASPRFFGDVQGDMVENTVPSSGQPIGYTCTISSSDPLTVGTWRGFGNVS